MKHLERITGLFALATLILRLFDGPKFSLPMLGTMLLLSFMHFYLSIGLFNGIRLRQLFDKTQYIDLSRGQIIASIVAGLGLTAITLGVLFKLMYWPGSNELILAGGFLLLGPLIFSLLNFQKIAFTAKSILIRAVLIGGVGLSIFFTPKDTLLSMLYRDHPGYVEAFKNAMAEPENAALWEKLREEQKKMDAKR
ncbi:MAG: hypothetical protein AAF206_20040 [Bacteroidota bacterium]